MKKLIYFTSIAASLLGASINAETLDGTWTSVAPENQGSMYATRTFEFSGNEWSIDFTAYADAEAAQQLFSVDVNGTYLVGNDSEVDGARDAVFFISERIVTASEIGVGIFESMGCALEAGVPQSLRDEGCGFLPAVMDSAIEYDLVAIEDGHLFLGERSGNLSVTRPGALIAYPLEGAAN